MNNTKSVDFFEENGVAFTRIDCRQSIANPGHFTDIYKGSDGRIVYKERLKNAISSPSHVRNNLEGSLISISQSMKRILDKALDNCSSKDLNTLILQSQHHIDNAEKYFLKQNGETGEKLFIAAIDDCVSAVIDERCLSTSADNILFAIANILESEQINLERNNIVKEAFSNKLNAIANSIKEKDSTEEKYN